MVEDALVDSLRQAGAGVRFDWGPTPATALPGPASALVVIDVLSFTTAVSVATGRGIAVAPYPLEEAGAAELAGRLGAALAVPRRERSPAHPWTLSPVAFLAAPWTARLVLPSPNGSAIAAAVAGVRRDEDPVEHTGGPVVLAGYRTVPRYPHKHERTYVRLSACCVLETGPSQRVRVPPG